MAKTLYIEDSSELKTLCDALSPAEWIAIDTEFLRESTYRPNLCLIQLATPTLSACVDPLAVDIAPLLDVIYDSNILKVFHAASQDLEIFHSLRGKPPEPIFDTQVAAPLLGHPDQMGYARLVQALLDVELSKAHSRTDWSRRPLSAAQINYAADDVIYLAQLFPKMRDELNRLGRLTWLEPEFAGLVDPLRYDKPLEDLWQKIRGVERLKGETLAIVQELAAWREQAARSANLPRNWLMKDDVLIDIAKLKPQDDDTLSQIRSLSDGARRRHGNALLKLVQECAGRQPRPQDKRRKEKLKPRQEVLVDLLEAVVRLRADEHDINPSQLASRRELEQLVGEGAGPLTQGGWKQQLVGDELQRVLAGECILQVRNGQMSIDDPVK